MVGQLASAGRQQRSVAMACSREMLPAADGRVSRWNAVVDGSSTNTGSATVVAVVAVSDGFGPATVCVITSNVAWRRSMYSSVGGVAPLIVPSRSGCTAAAAMAWM